MNLRTAILTLTAMLAFAGNSLLCRLALKDGQIDAASFAAIRIVAGAALRHSSLLALQMALTCSGGRLLAPELSESGRR